MNNKATAAVERAAEALHYQMHMMSGAAPPTFRDEAYEALNAALDVEEIARVLYHEGAWCGGCEHDSWDTCRDCRETVTGYASALRTTLIGHGEKDT